MYRYYPSRRPSPGTMTACEMPPMPCPAECMPGCDGRRDCCMEPAPRELPIAAAYIPSQSWQMPMDLRKALTCGTIFPCLVKPLKGGGI